MPEQKFEAVLSSAVKASRTVTHEQSAKVTFRFVGFLPSIKAKLSFRLARPIPGIQQFRPKLTPAAIFLPIIKHELTATLTFLGVLVRVKELAAKVTFAGSVASRLIKTFFPTLEFAGVLKKEFTVTATFKPVLSFSVSLVKGFTGLKKIHSHMFASPVAQAILNLFGIISLWELQDSNPGASKVRDSAGFNDANYAIPGPTFREPGPVPYVYSVSFDGNALHENFIQITNESITKTLRPATITMGIFVNVPENKPGGLIDTEEKLSSPVGAVGISLGFGVIKGSGSKLEVGCFNEKAEVTHSVVGPELTPNKWYFVAVTHGGPGTKLRLYLGKLGEPLELVGEATGTLEYNKVFSEPFTIARTTNLPEAESYLKGKIAYAFVAKGVVGKEALEKIYEVANGTVVSNGILQRIVTIGRVASLQPAAAILLRLKIAFEPILAPTFVSPSVFSNVVKGFAPSVQPTVNVVREITYTFLSRLTFAGSLPRELSRALNAIVSFVVSLNRNVLARKLEASVSFAATMFAAIPSFLKASLSFVGKVPPSIFNRTFKATATFLVTIPSKPIRTFQAGLQFSKSTEQLVVRLVHSFQPILSFFGKVVEPRQKPIPPTDYVANILAEEQYIAVFRNGKVQKVAGIRYYEMVHSDLDYPELELVKLTKKLKAGQLPE